MSDSVKKKTTVIRYLLTGTTEILYKAAVEDKANFSLASHAADLLAKGYEILESDLPQGDFEASLKAKTYTVYLRERVTIVFPGQPKHEGEPVADLNGMVWPAGLEESDLTAVRSRHIHYQYQDGSQAFPTVSETVEFERSAMVNHVTGQVTYMPWQAIGEGEFSNVETPNLKGYSADIVVVEAIEDLDLETSSDQDLVVTFSKEKQFVTLEVLDISANDIIFSDNLVGETDDLIDYPVAALIDQYLAKGYEIVANPLEGEHRFGQGQDNRESFQIELRPREVLVHEGDLPEVGQPVYPELENSVVWPAGVSASKLRRLVTRTIINQHETGEVVETVEQTVEFRRPAKINLLTQEVSYEDWELVSDQAVFPAFVPAELKGYAPRPRQLPELSPITADSANLKEVITYTRQIQRVSLRFVDQSQEGMVLYQTQLVGKTGERIRFDHKKKTQEFLNIGYEVVANDFPEGAKFTSEVTQQEVYTIVLEPKTLVVSSKEPKVAGRFIDESSGNGPKWPVGVDEQALRHSVTRTVHYRYENGKPAAPSHVDTILFERQAELNLVTSQVTYSPWTTTEAGFEAHEVPRLDGYYANRDVVPGISDLTVDSPDFEVSVYYIKTSNQIRYTIHDVTTDQELETKLVNGRSVQKLREEINRKLQPYLAKGYKLENSDRLNLALKNPDTSTLTIELSQQVREVSPDQPQATHGLVDGYSRLNWPSGLEADQLKRTVVRQIRLAYANGEEISGHIDQEVTFTRSAHVNLVTGEVSYGEWQAQQPVFLAIELPEMEGYSPSLTVIPEAEASAGQLNHLVEVIYYPQPAQVAVLYLEEGSDHELYRDDFSAQVGETFSYRVAERLPLLDLAAYEVVESNCPEELRFEAGEQTYSVVLKPKTVLVTADAPRQAGTTSWLEGYGPFNWPEGLDKEALSGEVRRLISYKTVLGEVLVDHKLEQEAHLTRSAMVNLATKEVTYQPWVGTVDSLEAVKSPVFEGLTPSFEEVPVLELAGNDDIINRTLDVVVTYSKQPFECEFRFMDSLRQELLGAVKLTVLDKEDSLEAYQELLATYQQLGYVVTEGQELDLRSWTLAEPKVFDVSLKPQLMTVSLDHIEDRFASFDEEIASQLQALEGLSRLDLSRQVNRTIKYLYTNGKTVAKAYTDSITFKRSARVNLVTGEIFYDDWTSYYPIFDEVLSPVIDNYTPSKEIVEAIENVMADSQDMIETIVYTRNVQQVVVSVVDKATGNIIYAESITGTDGVSDAGYEVSKFVKKGQDLVSNESGDEAPGLLTDETGRAEQPVVETSPVPSEEKQAAPEKQVSETNVAKKNSELKQALSSPNKPETKDIKEAKEVIIGLHDTKLHKAYRLRIADLARTIVREVKFVDESGQELHESLTHRVSYQRQAKGTDKSREVTFTEWQAIDESVFPKVTSPRIEGMEPDKLSLPAFTPNPDGASLIEEQITYHSTSAIENISIVFIDQESGADIMNFNFVDKGAAYTEKKLKKGESFLAYKGYEVVSSDYPDKGQLVAEDTILYQVIVRQQVQDKQTKKTSDDGEDAAISRKLRETINNKPNLGEKKPTKSYADLDDEADEWLEPASKEGKQKGLFNFLFKD